jgi:uncharacterized protein (TIGR02217 family)
MAHIATRMTLNVENGATRIEEQDVEIVRSDGGNEVRNTRWSQPLLRFEISFPTSLRDDAVFLEVRNAYRACRGALHSFKFRDWSDYQATDEPFGTGDGSTTVFNLYKTYEFGAQAQSRRIYNPVSPITIKKNGVTMGAGYSVNYTTGVVTFSVAPAGPTPGPADELTWTGEFDVPVRFDSPLQSTGLATHLEHHEGVVLQEVRL